MAAVLSHFDDQTGGIFLPSLNQHVKKGFNSAVLWDRATGTVEADF